MPEEFAVGEKGQFTGWWDINTDEFSETHIFAILSSRFVANASVGRG